MLIEIERTFLVAEVPEWLEKMQPEEMTDYYLPSDMSTHPKLRLRQKGDKYEITKKSVVVDGDASQQLESTIKLSSLEFEALRNCSSRKVSKRRYSVDTENWTTEFDVFTGSLKGLILVDFEFKDEKSMREFVAPDYCGADVTQEDFIAGGMLAGRTLNDIASDLKRLGYTYPQ
ncbi:hypothetical protein [Corynebacterium casei]|uniref:CYTH domain-containing protein n=1 Tax=Corynebacterium casei UCMA 3821 TaxID=1110505 RepID=G7HWJ0_9CORY|nr:hypothetical protein [Corynebacterium casei]CCE54555.1 putative uncharacterized protein [Corynebacterium casei UCMA 3821]